MALVKRRALVALGVAAVVLVAWGVIASSLSAAKPPGANWSRPEIVRSGNLAVLYPRAWTASLEETTIVIRSGGTRIMVVDYGATHAGSFPPRPDHFELDAHDRHFLSCLGFDGWSVTFTERGQVIQAFVKLSPGTRKADAAEVLDRLVVS